MAHHEGVTCDFCMAENFSGKRFKCLICYDFDLCESCVMCHQSSGKHSSTHAMQCILTPHECDKHFKGEENNGTMTSYTCPYCGDNGFSKILLLGHCTVKHLNDESEVICPVCATSSRAEPNFTSADLIHHLTNSHKTSQSYIQERETSRVLRRLLKRPLRGGMTAAAATQRTHMSAFSSNAQVRGRELYSDMTEAIESIRHNTFTRNTNVPSHRGRGRGLGVSVGPIPASRAEPPSELMSGAGSYYPLRTMADVVANGVTGSAGAAAAGAGGSGAGTSAGGSGGGGGAKKKDNKSNFPLIDKILDEKISRPEFTCDERSYAIRGVMLAMSSNQVTVSLRDKIDMVRNECKKVDDDETVDVATLRVGL